MGDVWILQKQTLRQGFECKYFIWSMIARNTRVSRQIEDSQQIVCYQATLHCGQLELNPSEELCDQV